MICWKTVKEFFGFETKAKVVQPLTEGATKSPVKKQGISKSPTRPPPPAQPPRKKAPINARNYYRRNGRYYSSGDDSIIEDTILLLALADLYGAGEMFGQEPQDQHWNTTNNEPDVVEEPTEDLLDIDVSETPVMAIEEVSTTPVYTPPPEPEPEPVRQESYSSGYSDSCDSCDSCGGDD